MTQLPKPPPFFVVVLREEIARQQAVVKAATEKIAAIEEYLRVEAADKPSEETPRTPA